MGCINTKLVAEDNTFPFRVSTFYVDMSNTFAKDKNISELVEYFFASHNGYEMDVMCLQGIANVDIYKDIIKFFKRKTNEHNNKIKTNQKLELYYYPHDNNNNTSTDEYETWSLSDQTSDDESTCGKLIISRHKSIIYIEDNKYIKRDKRAKSLRRMNTLSCVTNISNQNKNDKIQVINICVQGIIISIYNVSMTQSFNGNNIEYNDRIKNLNNFMDVTSQEILSYCNINGNNNFDNRCIHILCGNFNINEMKNNSINKSYVRLIKKLNAIDIFRYVTGMRGKNSLKIKYDTNILFSRNNYLLIHVGNIDKLDDVKAIGKNLYDEYGILIIDTNINQFMRDLFIHFPTDAVILFKKDWKNKNTGSVDDQNEMEYENIDFTAEEFRDMIINDSNTSQDTMSSRSSNESIELEEIIIEKISNDDIIPKIVKVHKVNYLQNNDEINKTIIDIMNNLVDSVCDLNTQNI